MADIVAPQGSPLGFAVISCHELEKSLAFYRDVIGFAAESIATWCGADFERFWALPQGSTARACLLTANNCMAGRVLLLEFAARSRELIQVTSNSQVIGLANLNFYTADAHVAVANLRTAGYHFWTEPTQHSLNAGVGNPIEVVFDGPDSVAMNLVELTSKDLTTRIGQMRAYVEAQGYTRQGFTPVVTTSHVARSLELTCEFYEKVCGMGRLFSDVMTADHVNAFLRLPQGGKTAIVFMQGNHMFGKIAVSEPLNYLEACTDLRSRAHAPNIGYLAHGFEVRDMRHALAQAAAIRAELVAPQSCFEVPGLGSRDHALLRNPGSGALMWLVSRANG